MRLLLAYITFAIILSAQAQDASNVPYQLSPDECRLAITDLVQTQQGVFDRERKDFDEAEKQRFEAETKAFESAKYVAARFNSLLDDLQDERIKIIAKTKTYPYGEWGMLIDVKLASKQSENVATCTPDKTKNIPAAIPIERYQDKIWLLNELHDGIAFRNPDGSYPSLCGNRCGASGEEYYVDIRTGASDPECSTAIAENKFLIHLNQAHTRFRIRSYSQHNPISALSVKTLQHYLACEVYRFVSEHDTACGDYKDGVFSITLPTETYESHSDVVRACDGPVCFEKEIMQLQTMSKVTPEEIYKKYEGKSEITPMRQAPDHKIEKVICAQLISEKSPCTLYYENASGKPNCSGYDKSTPRVASQSDGLQKYAPRTNSLAQPLAAPPAKETK